jgi:hypothetical protein
VRRSDRPDRSFFLGAAARLPWIGSWSLPLIVYGEAATGTRFSRSRLNEFDWPLA